MAKRKRKSTPQVKRKREESTKPKLKKVSSSIQKKTSALSKAKAKPKAPASTYPRPRAKTSPVGKPKARAGKKKAPTGRQPSGPGDRTRPVKKPSHVRPAPVKKKRAKLAQPQRGKPAPRKRAKLSQSPEAIRSRKRRREARGIREALEAEKERQREKRRERRKKKKIIGGGGKYYPDERALAIGWLEALRNAAAELYPISLEITEAEIAAKTPWLAVGRFDPVDEIGYAELGEILERWEGDAILEAMIHPQRLSQIRIVYSDPNAKRGEGDSIVSKVGAWEFVVSDLIGEILGYGRGGGDSESDEEALAARYDATQIPHFYVYFSSEIQNLKQAGPWVVQR